MQYGRPVEDIVRARRSVRTYDGTALAEDVLVRIRRCLEEVSAPCADLLRYRLVDGGGPESAERLGTYGTIRGARHFIVAALSASDAEGALELGRSLEEAVLFLTSLDLGTCWLGGTFHRSAFARAAGLRPGERVPIIVSVGRPAPSPSLPDRLLRGMSGGDRRKPFEAVYFDGDLRTPLTPEAAGGFALPLEMVRLAPSASNRQPWKVVKTGRDLHFLIDRRSGYSVPSYDFSRNDLGIALCHFEQSARERGLPGGWSADPLASFGAGTEHVRTWRTATT